MAELLDETYGLMVYQEDVAKIAIAMAGFDAASADGLRKILSKKNKEERLRDYRERFARGAAERGVDQATVAKVWDMILSFAGYSFCKPHSASYALVSFKSASLRAHHPGEFIAAVISNGGGYYSAFAYISEARRMGLEILLPDVNESRGEYTGRTFDGTGSTVGTVRVGLMQLKGFPDAALDALLAERARGGPFASFDEFLERAGSAVGPAAIRILIRAGAFDSLLAAERSGAARCASPGVGNPLADSGSAARPEHRGDLFWRLTAWERSRGRTLAARLMNGRAGSAAAPRLLLPPVAIEPLPRSGAYDERTMLEQEIESLGFLISRHPLSLFRREIAEVKPVPARELPEHVGRLVRVVGWYVTGKTVQTRKGEPMEFLSFEDTTALYETTFFPGAYARFCHMMTKVRPYVLTGRVEEDFGAVSLNVSDVRFLDARGGLLRGGEDGPVSAPHVGGTSPGSDAWGRSFAGSASFRSSRPAPPAAPPWSSPSEMERTSGARTAPCARPPSRAR
jgi:error-prone DNA polymerase